MISKGDINPLIRACSSLIVTGFSTVIIQGQILQKPVITIPIINYNWGQPSVYRENSCKVVEIDDLDKILKKIDDVEYKNQIITNGNQFIDRCFKHKNKSTELIWKYIKNTIKK